MLDSFGSYLYDEGFFKWLAKSLLYKPNRLRSILNENKANLKNSSIPENMYQEIYDFWLANSINSNESMYNIRKMRKRDFLEHYKNIVDTNLIQETKEMKSGTKPLYSAGRKIYTESVRQLHEKFNQSHENVSLAVFFKTKPFYCVRPTEKAKQSCLCISCLNPHLMIKAINIYRKSKQLESHPSLTQYINELKTGVTFPEITDRKLCKYYTYRRAQESYIGKEGKPVEYTRTSRVDECKPVNDIVNFILDGGEKYLKHRSYVDNYSTSFPLMKDGYEGKYIELDFSQNVALRPKHEVQSTHFSGKQFSLHCAIAEPFEKRYFYHLSDDTKHDGIFVDLAIRDIIQRYDIKNEDLWIQSDNASSQYKNKLPFALYQQLSNEFNLRIIRTYGAAGHRKGVIDAMSSFGVKNVLRHDIVIQDVSFNTSEEICDYLTIKNPKFLLRKHLSRNTC